MAFVIFSRKSHAHVYGRPEHKAHVFWNFPSQSERNNFVCRLICCQLVPWNELYFEKNAYFLVVCDIFHIKTFYISFHVRPNMKKLVLLPSYNILNQNCDE